MAPCRFTHLLDHRLFASVGQLQPEALLEKLVFNIARKPRHLPSHVQRIYLCYENAWQEPLLAALVDLLIVLDGRGRVLAKRLALGARDRLPASATNTLHAMLAGDLQPGQWPGNRHSVFSKGREGTDRLIRRLKQPGQPDYDPLKLARDHIEYSQLDQAKQVLQQAVLANPGREALQQELLDLYKSTRDGEGFWQMFNELRQSGVPMSNGWLELSHFFKGQD